MRLTSKPEEIFSQVNDELTEATYSGAEPPSEDEAWQTEYEDLQEKLKMKVANNQFLDYTAPH